MTAAPMPAAHQHTHLSFLPGRAWGFGALALAWYRLAAFALGLPGFGSVFVHGLTASFLNQPIEVEALRPRLAEAIGRPQRRPQLVLRFGSGPDVPHSPREAVEQILVDSGRDG